MSCRTKNTTMSKEKWEEYYNGKEQHSPNEYENAIHVSILMANPAQI